MKKPVYIRCPRCELNYIQKKDKMCSVCQAELSAKDDYIDDIDLELCPICKTNYIQSDEIMCSNCLKEHQTDDGELTTDWEDLVERDENDELITDEDETAGMTTVTDLTDSSLLDDEIAPDIDFGDDPEDVFDDEEFDDEEDDDDVLDDIEDDLLLDDDDEDYDDDDE